MKFEPCVKWSEYEWHCDSGTLVNCFHLAVMDQTVEALSIP
jgi:hypothetical protein